MKVPRLLGLAAIAVTAALTLAGCSGASHADDTPAPSTPGLSGDLTISAAASLSG